MTEDQNQAPDNAAPVLDSPVAACLTLLGERGWHGFALRDVAAACGLSLADLYRRYPTRPALLAAWLATIDAALLQGVEAEEPGDTVRDRLFDTMMRRYDLLVPHRAAVRRLREDLRRDPAAALALAPAIDRAMAVVLEAAGLASDGWRGHLRRQGLALVHARVLSVWEDDDTADLSRTMVALDRHLKTAERRLGQLSRVFRRLGHPAAAART
jgi:AcrR family transcriptional regulator